jgi:hypothetical protein
MMRSLFLVTTLAVILSAGCGSQSPDGSGTSAGNPAGPSTTPGGSSPSTTQLAFSTTASKGWSTIDVSVDGRYIGTISQYFPTQGTASCATVSGARIVAPVTPGSHTYSARSNLGATWSGSATLSNGGCHEVILTCPGGDCST